MKATNILKRVLAVLGVFAEARPEWTPDELMKEFGYSRPTLYRYLKTLREAGFEAPNGLQLRSTTSSMMSRGSSGPHSGPLGVAQA